MHHYHTSHIRSIAKSDMLKNAYNATVGLKTKKESSSSRKQLV